MNIDPISRLNHYLEDPVSPTWSSQGLIDLFADLEGDMKQKQQIVLRLIDEKFSQNDSHITKAQFHFLRDVTLHTYYSKTRVRFSPEEMKWLLQRFATKATQQRAILIYILLDSEDLSEQLKQKIKTLLAGTFVESFIQMDENT
ncbi:MAG: hypothetical protein AAF587_19295 [Bacteroidota bacterium]